MTQKKRLNKYTEYTSMVNKKATKLEVLCNIMHISTIQNYLVMVESSHVLYDNLRQRFQLLHILHTHLSQYN